MCMAFGADVPMNLCLYCCLEDFLKKTAQSLYSLRQHLKTFLFQRSFPDVIVTLVDLAIVLFY